MEHILNLATIACWVFGAIFFLQGLSWLSSAREQTAEEKKVAHYEASIGCFIRNATLWAAADVVRIFF